MITSYIPWVQYWNKENDIDAICRAYSDFISSVCTRVVLCTLYQVSFCCPATRTAQSPLGSLMLPSITTIPSQALKPWQAQSVLCTVILHSGIYICDYVTFWGLVVFIQHDFLEVHPRVEWISSLFLILLCSIPWDGYITRLLHCSSFEGHLGHFQFLPITNKTPVNICVSIWLYVLPVTWENAWECHCGVIC